MLRMPHEVSMEDQEGITRTYTIHKFSAYHGREIATQYPQSGMPKIGDYKVNEALSQKMMSYVTIDPGEGGAAIQLTTKTLIENHCPDWEVLARLEIELMRYNCSFFAEGKVSDLLDVFKEKGKVLISQMLTAFSEQSSAMEKQQDKS